MRMCVSKKVLAIRSFKLRGAYHKIYKLSDAERKFKIVCASAGNHAQGVALLVINLESKEHLYLFLHQNRNSIKFVCLGLKHKLDLLAIHLMMPMLLLSHLDQSKSILFTTK